MKEQQKFQITKYKRENGIEKVDATKDLLFEELKTDKTKRESNIECACAICWGGNKT